MEFNSYGYLLAFLPAVLLACRVADGAAWARTGVLLAVSAAFYAAGSAWFLGPVVVAMLVNWLLAQAHARSGAAWPIWMGVAGTVVGLAAARHGLGGGFGSVGHAGGVPVGLGFLAVHQVMFLMAVRRGAAVGRLDRHALGCLFFPAVASGPLARWDGGWPGARRVFGPGWEARWALGVTCLVVGLLAKVGVADPIGRVVEPVFAAAAAPGAAPGVVMDGSAWLALGFGVQLFFDFAGYCDMAIGAALLLGVRLPENFAAPFRAGDVLGFWRRWHMTLWRFLRRDVFAGLAQAGAVVAVAGTAVVAGLWHGMGWVFVLWGLANAAAVLVVLAWRRLGWRLPAVVGWLLTMGFVLPGFAVLRAGSVEVAGKLLAGLAVAPPAAVLGKLGVVVAGLALAAAMPPSRAVCRWLAARRGLGVPVVLGLACIVAMVLMGESETYAFIFFRF